MKSSALSGLFLVPRVAYSGAQKAEAVALATVAGAEAASRQLGITVGAIRRWCELAGKTPRDAIAEADWVSLGQLARSQVAARLASGKESARNAAIIAGIADRNSREAPLPEPESDPEAQAWTDTFTSALEARYGPLTEDGLVLLIGDTMRWLVDAENEVPLHQLDPTDLVGNLPADWAAWHAERKARHEAWMRDGRARSARSRPAWESYFRGEITEAQRDAWIADGLNPHAEADAALLAAAEAFLREHAA